MTDGTATADLINLCRERCIKPMPCLCDKCFEGVPIEEWTTDDLTEPDPADLGILNNANTEPPQFPPVVSADKMWSECRRDEWQMAPHPILLERGRDHG